MAVEVEVHVVVIVVEVIEVLHIMLQEIITMILSMPLHQSQIQIKIAG